MCLASTSVLVTEQTPPNCCRHCLCFQEESQLPLASSECSPTSPSVSDLVSFQITASALGLGVCEILHEPFKRGVSVFYYPPAFLYTSPAHLQLQMFWGLLGAEPHVAPGKPAMGLRPLTP